MLGTRPSLSRYPGVRFQAERPAVPELPRMDIAAFAGFAARGPLHTPVLIEEMPRFLELFGPAPPLAWDGPKGGWRKACLAGAVADFFQQGGRRCWVVRVADADQAVTNQFPLAGLLRHAGSGYEAAGLRSRSPGSWSDAHRVSATLLVDPLPLPAQTVVPSPRLTVTIGVSHGRTTIPGDLLRLDFIDGDGHLVYVAVEDVTEEAMRGTGEAGMTVIGPAFWFRATPPGQMLHGVVRSALPADLAPAAPAPAVLDTSELQLVGESGFEPGVGTWLRFDAGAETYWLVVERTHFGRIDLSAAWQEGHVGGAELMPIRATRVMLALRVQEDAATQHVLGDLAFSPPHHRYIGYLPDDTALFATSAGLPGPAAGYPGEEIRQEAAAPRFPLAGLDDSGVILPLGLDVLPPRWTHALPTQAHPLIRDGLVPPEDPAQLTGDDWSGFLARIFLDPVLARSGRRALLADAFDRRFEQQQALLGLHSILPLEDVSLLVLPDAAQPGWRLDAGAAVEPEQDAVETTEPAPCAHDNTLFQPKPAPPDVVDARPAAPPDGATPAAPDVSWVLLDGAVYVPDGLLLVQRKAAELAAARADMTVVLAMPAHLHATAAVLYARRLEAELAQGGEDVAGFVALYHPWLLQRDDGDGLVLQSPDGAAAGVIAGRTLARGAWTPPANRRVTRALALQPAMTRAEQEILYRAAINSFDRSPQGFVLWGANTLSTSPDLIPLNVRRLLILLRRVALRAGQRFVFEAHSPAFRRAVAQGLERQLAVLFNQGAFAGQNPSQAYRVVVDESVNTAGSVGQGRFVVELRVAPSQPLTFITVRLIQLESGALQLQEL